jgi:hypothetical protein
MMRTVDGKPSWGLIDDDYNVVAVRCEAVEPMPIRR